MNKILIILALIPLFIFACKNEPTRLSPDEFAEVLDTISIQKAFILKSPRLGKELEKPEVYVEWEVLEESSEYFWVFVSTNPTFKNAIRHSSRGRNYAWLGMYNPGQTYFLKIVRGEDYLISSFSIKELIDWQKMTYIDTVVHTRDDFITMTNTELGRYLDTLHIIRDGGTFGMKLGGGFVGFDVMNITDSLGTMEFSNIRDINDFDHFGAGLILRPADGSVTAYTSSGKTAIEVKWFESK